MAEKVIPHSIDAEKSVLGAMFLTQYALEKACETLTRDLFYLDANGKIFEVLQDLNDKKIPVDIMTVNDALENKKWLNQIGGIEYLTEIINYVPTASNVEQYIKIVEEKAILRRLIEAGTTIVGSAYDATDPINEILDSAEKKILNVVKTRKGTEFKKIQEVLLKAQNDLENLARNGNAITGIPTGFRELDKLTSGIHKNELIIIAARPAMGKTAFALNLVTNMAVLYKKTVALFNLEMGAEQLAMRMISSVGEIEGDKLKTGQLLKEDWNKVDGAMMDLGETKIYIDDTPGMDIGEIRAKCRRLASSSDGLDIVIIDYLQLIQGGARYAGNRVQEISEISRSLKTMAMELEIPVIALAQLSRSVEVRDDKRPILSDLRESGSIEQDADIVAFLYRDDYYNGNKEEKFDNGISESEFIIRKHRNGPVETVNLIFNRNISKFMDRQ